MQAHQRRRTRHLRALCSSDNNCGHRTNAIRFGLRLAFLLRSGCCGNTAGEPNGGRKLESRKSSIVRARVRSAIGTRFCWTP